MNLVSDPAFQLAVVVFLAVSLVLSGVAIGGLMILWWRHVGLVARMTRQEARSEASLSHEELRRLYEELANIKGQLTTTNQMMRTVQQHLLESE